MPARACGFESHFRYHSKPLRIRVLRRKSERKADRRATRINGHGCRKNPEQIREEFQPHPPQLGGRSTRNASTSAPIHSDMRPPRTCQFPLNLAESGDESERRPRNPRRNPRLHEARTSSMHSALLPADMVARMFAEFALEDAPPLPSSLPGEDSDPTPCHRIHRQRLLCLD